MEVGLSFAGADRTRASFLEETLLGSQVESFVVRIPLLQSYLVVGAEFTSGTPQRIGHYENPVKQEETEVIYIERLNLIACLSSKEVAFVKDMHACEERTFIRHCKRLAPELGGIGLVLCPMGDCAGLKFISLGAVAESSVQ